MKGVFSYFTLLFIFVNMSYADDIKYLSIGRLQSWFSSAGCEIETGRTGESSNLVDGFSFPALFPDQDMQVQKGLWIGCKSYTDPLVNNKVYNHKVVHVGPRAFAEETQIMPVDFTMYGKFDHPSVYVDNFIGSNLDYWDKDVVVDENLVSDRMLYNKFNTSMGITVTRRIYAFGQEGRDDYFIYKYTLKNTGIYDEDGSTQSQTLNDVYLFLQYSMAMSNYCGMYGYKWMPQHATWGANTVTEVLHPDYGDDHYGFFMFHGLLSDYGIELNSGTSSGDNHGAPNGGDGDVAADGFLGGSQFPGVVTIHADKSSDDRSNDLSKMASAPFFHSDDNLTQPPHDQYNETKMTKEYQWMVAGLPVSTHAGDLGYPHNPGHEDVPFSDVRDADNHPDIGAGGVSQGLSYGPYTLAQGDSVNIVIAEAVGSIDWNKRIEVGDKFYYEKKPYTLPDGTTTDDVWHYKDAWVFSGRDSLINAFDKAIDTYNKWKNGENVVLPPPPPSLFTVTSGGDKITLEWSNNVESYENLGGYRIYRQKGNPDTTFALIYECGEGTKNSIVYTYEDRDVRYGIDYYYYITSFDDGQVDPDGNILESGLFWTKTNLEASIKNANLVKKEDVIYEYNLYNNYPNPFNPVTNIKYSIAECAHAELSIYNLRGQLLEVLVNEAKASGNYIVNWNASKYPSGIYYYKLKVGNFQSVKKCILLK